MQPIASRGATHPDGIYVCVYESVYFVGVISIIQRGHVLPISCWPTEQTAKAHKPGPRPTRAKAHKGQGPQGPRPTIAQAHKGQRQPRPKVHSGPGPQQPKTHNFSRPSTAKTHCGEEQADQTEREPSHRGPFFQSYFTFFLRAAAPPEP